MCVRVCESSRALYVFLTKPWEVSYKPFNTGGDHDLKIITLCDNFQQKMNMCLQRLPFQRIIPFSNFNICTTVFVNIKHFVFVPSLCSYCSLVSNWLKILIHVVLYFYFYSRTGTVRLRKGLLV